MRHWRSAPIVVAVAEIVVAVVQQKPTALPLLLGAELACTLSPVALQFLPPLAYLPAAFAYNTARIRE